MAGSFGLNRALSTPIPGSEVRWIWRGAVEDCECVGSGLVSRLPPSAGPWWSASLRHWSRKFSSASVRKPPRGLGVRAMPVERPRSAENAQLAQAVRRSIEALVDPEQVIELRALGVRRRGGGRGVVESGYFDDLDQFADSAAELSQWAKGVYWTLNPVNPALLARSRNRLRLAGDEPLTSDGDVVARRFLLVDFDPVRPAGLSSSESEHQAALDRACECAGALRDEGWPAPVIADSGNGAHLLYRIDEPVNDAGLVRSCLAALAFRFGDGTVDVDESVHNPARICKVYGTWARKGDCTEDRPHRQSRLLSTPDVLVPVPNGLLRNLAACALQVPDEPGQRARREATDAKVDVARWLSEHGIEATGPSPWKGALRWVLPTCPWNPAHVNRSAYVVQFPSGAVAAGCHHNSCKGKTWRDLRQLVGDMPWSRQPARDDSPAPLSNVARGARGRLPASDLAAAVLETDRFAVDRSTALWWYHGGVYKPQGERRVAARVKALVHEWGVAASWSSHKARETAEYIRADAPELWQRPPIDRLNLSNGLLDLGSRTLGPHSPEHLSPVQLPAAYDPEAGCPAWERFVDEVFPTDSVQIAWEIAAWLMVPLTSVQKALLLLGEGSNGKSAFLAGLAAFLGHGNCSAVPLHKLEADRFASARLFGKLANICPDLHSASLPSSSVFKAITGGDRLSAETKYGPGFEFECHARLVFSANHPPRSDDASHAFYRRWLCIPFDRCFSGRQARKREELDAELASPKELSGLLNKALAVLPRVLRGGLTETASMREAFLGMRRATDPLEVWLDQETVEAPSSVLPKQRLVQAYQDHCERCGIPPMLPQHMGRRLKRLRPRVREAQRTIDGAKQWVWLGIQLKTDADSG